MILLWLVAGVSLLVALVALGQVRRAAGRIERLSQMYWDLKYQNSELRAQLEHLAGGAARPPEPPAVAERPAVDGFVPLTSLKR